jgi:hypothetical protein
MSQFIARGDGPVTGADRPDRSPDEDDVFKLRFAVAASLFGVEAISPWRTAIGG